MTTIFLIEIGLLLVAVIMGFYFLLVKLTSTHEEIEDISEYGNEIETNTRHSKNHLSAIEKLATEIKESNNSKAILEKLDKIIELLKKDPCR